MPSQYETLNKKTDDQLLEIVADASMGSVTIEAAKQILLYRDRKSTSGITRGLAWATWGLFLATAILVLVTYFCK